MISACLLALLATSQTAAARTCQTLQEVRKANPTAHLRYRQVTRETRCWFSGKTPDKSEFSLPASLASSRGGSIVRGAPQLSPKRHDANGLAPIMTEAAPSPREITSYAATAVVKPAPLPVPLHWTLEMFEEEVSIQSAIDALCGPYCTFDNRWRLK